MGRLSTLTNGIIKENPVLVLLLGTCPSLAVSTMAVNGIGMGLAATVVLICSNVVIALLKDVIPGKVRIPCYVVIIAGFVTMVSFIVKAYAPSIDKSLGIFLPLIVVNCIILGRAEVFASKNKVLDSFLDAVGMGIGFTLALLIMGSIREIIGSGTWFDIPITGGRIDPVTLLILPPGGFFVYGCLIAGVNWVSKNRAIKKRSMGCKGCPSAAICAGSQEGGAN